MFSGEPGSRPSRGSTGGVRITTVVVYLHNSGLEVRGVHLRDAGRSGEAAHKLTSCSMQAWYAYRHGLRLGRCGRPTSRLAQARSDSNCSQNSQVHILCEDAMLHITASRKPKACG